MHIVSADETAFYFDEILQDQEEIIITSYHENMFGLSELGKSIKVTLITENVSTSNSHQFQEEANPLRTDYPY